MAELRSHTRLDGCANGSAYTIAFAVAFAWANKLAVSGAIVRPNLCADS
jgi:hypothetical protein